MKHTGNYRHGRAKTKIYGIWCSMLSRCTASGDKAYKKYGGRGITVCERWMKFENFHADMGERPIGMSLDRIDNDGPYSPENCRWATRKQQATNRKTTRFYPHPHTGEMQSIAQLAEEHGIKYTTLWQRLARGWPLKEAVL